MEAYQKRVIDEKTELDAKIHALRMFIQNVVFDTIPDDERHLLLHQVSVMTQYSLILSKRIAKFKE